MPDKTAHGRSKAGVELTGDALDQMATEAEDGLDTSKLRRRPGRPSLSSGRDDSVPVRLDPELRIALDNGAETGNTTAADVASEAPHCDRSH